MRKLFKTDRTSQFLVELACGRFDRENVIVVAATSSQDRAAEIEAIAGYRKLRDKIKVVEFDDVSDPHRGGALSEGAAKDILQFLDRKGSKDAEFLFVCDGGMSRSAGMMCAWMRICGTDDLPVWVDARNYSPNVHVYKTLLSAAGIHLSERRLNEREEMKEMVLERKIAGRSSHAMHLLERPFRQICDGSKRCELRKLDAKRAAVAEGDLIAFSMTGSPDELVVARVTGCSKEESAEKLLRDGEVMRASGFQSYEDAIAGMREIYGSEPYPAVGIFLDASDWMAGASGRASMPKPIRDSMRGSAVMRDYFRDGMK